MSPEKLASIFSVASMTVRRWQKAPGNKKVPEVDQWNLIEGIYKLVLSGNLSTDSPAVQKALQCATPASFEAIARGLGVASGVFSSSEAQQDKMTMMLSQIGGHEGHKRAVEQSAQKFSYFKKMGSEWRHRISGLLQVVQSKKLSSFDKMVAYGSLFYLVTPLDLIPDHIPGIGLIDDFGVLGFAVAYYIKRYPEFFSASADGVGEERAAGKKA
jgi:uncharacterized membrane protein YkvA (DUF1232 family)